MPDVAGVIFGDRGTGRPFLILHGGGGPQTVSGFAELLAAERPARVITPTHPGFAGTPRPDSLASVAGLAELYVALLGELDVRDGSHPGGTPVRGPVPAPQDRDRRPASGLVLIV